MSRSEIAKRAGSTGAQSGGFLSRRRSQARNSSRSSRSAALLRPQLPILLATGYAELPEGAQLDLPRLAKPYHQDQLRDRLDQLLG
jgi:hypothetical protein